MVQTPFSPKRLQPRSRRLPCTWLTLLGRPLCLWYPAQSPEYRRATPYNRVYTWVSRTINGTVLGKGDKSQAEFGFAYARLVFSGRFPGPRHLIVIPYEVLQVHHETYDPLKECDLRAGTQ